MRLVITQYIDRSPSAVASLLDGAITHGVDVAAERVAADRRELRLERATSGLRLRGGLPALDGCELRVSGEQGLSVLELSVPWRADDGTRFRAANAFAHSVADALSASALAA